MRVVDHYNRSAPVPSQVSALSTGWLIGVAASVVAVAALAFVIWSTVLEMRRRRELLLATLDAVLICEGERIRAANISFARMVGARCSSLAGTRLADHFPDPALLLAAGDSKERIETEMFAQDRTTIPVEVLASTRGRGKRQRRIYAIRDLRQRRDDEERIHFLAYHDALTNLPNRLSFCERLDQDIRRAERTGEPLAVLALDLDHFKGVNDLFGHAAGDRLLRDVAARLRNAIRPYDMIGRFGGDEFAISLSTGAQPSTALQVSERLIAALDSPFDLGGTATTVGLSIGIAVYPDHGTDAETLLSRSDMALYRAKKSGRGAPCVFEQEMDEDLRERYSLAQDLRGALRRQEISLSYQPLTKPDGEVIGFETFMRWRHPRLGNVAPNVFLPVAEDFGYITSLGAWAIQEACREAATWPNKLRLAINVSPMQFQQGDLAATIIRVLAETGLEPDRLEIDITERVLIHQPARALSVLGALKAMGVRIAIDDFGTGASSLANLQSFPVDKIKIDRSFIAQLGTSHQADAIVKAVAGLGRGLDLLVAAEGVETESQLAMLIGEACIEMQGYLFSRALPIDSFDHITGKAESDSTDTEPASRSA